MDKIYDKDIREDLYDFMDIQFSKNRTFDEKVIGKSRADILMINQNELIGFEIKSDKDTYTRLKSQIKDYNKYCDRNFIVVGKSHQMHVADHIPKDWGIIVAESIDNQIQITLDREALENKKVKYKKQLSILWRPELNHILEINKLPKYKNKSKDFVLDKLLEKVELDILKKQMNFELFERDFNKADELFANARRNQARTKPYRKFKA